MPVAPDGTDGPLGAHDGWASGAEELAGQSVGPAQVDAGRDCQNSAACDTVSAAEDVVVDGSCVEVVELEVELELEEQTPGSSPSINFNSLSLSP